MSSGYCLTVKFDKILRGADSVADACMRCKIFGILTKNLDCQVHVIYSRIKDT